MIFTESRSDRQITIIQDRGCEWKVYQPSTPSKVQAWGVADTYAEAIQRAEKAWIEGETVIGHLTITDAPERTDHYECAAWHKTTRPVPGTYPIVESRTRFNGYPRTAVLVRVPSTITSACFVSRFGASYGNDEGPSMVGRIDEITYALATLDHMAQFDKNSRVWRTGSYGNFHDTREAAILGFNLAGTTATLSRADGDA